MKIRRITLTAAGLLLVAGSAVPAQQPTQPRPQQPGQQQQPQPDRQQQQQQQRQLQQQQRQQPGQTERAAAGYQLIPSEWALDADVVNTQDEELGDLTDLVLDAGNGRITHGVLSHGGVLGVGGKKVAIPWQSFQWNHDEQQLVLNMSERQLEQAPEFDPNKLNALGQQRGAFGFQGVQDGGAAAGEDDGWGVRSQYQNMIKSGQRTTVSGSVTNISRTAPMQGMNEGIVITISEEGGQERTVHLGPAWFVDRQDVMLRLGDQIEVQGVQVDAQGRQAIAAHELTSPYGSFRLRDEQGKPIWDANSGEAGTQQQQPRQPQQRQPAAQQPGQRQQPQTQPGQQQPGQQADPDRPSPPRLLGAAQPGRGVPQDEPLGTDRPQPDRSRQQPGQQQGQQQQNQGAQNLVLVSKVNDQSVTTLGEEDIGEVDDVVFDALSGKVAFVVVSGGDADNTAVPWSLLRLEPDGRLLAAQLDRNRLQDAPQFDDWDDLEDPAIVGRVYQHYGQPNPFQQDAGRTQRQQGMQQQQQPQAQPGMQQGQNAQAQQRYIQFFTSGRESTMTGKVQSVQQAAPMQGMEQIAVLTVEAQPALQQPGQQPGQQGQPQQITAHLAPQQFLQQHNLTFNQGDEVTLKGRTASVDGKPVFIATQIQKNGQSVTLRGNDGKPSWQSPR